MLPLLVLACSSPPAAPDGPPAAEPPAAAAIASTPDDEALVRANEGANALGKRLRERLTAELKAHGPEAAATVCADEAQAIGAAVASESGVAVGRASLRTRNPAHPPPAWVSDWLAEQGERPAAGVDGRSVVVEVDGARVARVLRPIAVEPPCLACHGPADQLAPGVRDLLAARYPTDAATGYAIGDLRGALWAEAVVR